MDPTTEWIPPAAPSPSQSNLPGAFSPPAGIAPGQLFELITTATLAEEYTDNFNLFVSQAAGTGRDLESDRAKVSNFRTRFSPGLTLFVNSARTKGFVSGDLAVVYDTAASGLKGSLLPSLFLSVRHEFSPRLSLTVSDSFSRNDNPFTGDPFGIRRERRVYSRNSFVASVDWLIDVIATQYYYRMSVFIPEGDSVSGNVSGNETTFGHVVGASATLPIGVLNSLRGGYELQLTNASDRGSTLSNLVYLSFSRQVGQFASAGINTSYRYQTGTGQTGTSGQAGAPRPGGSIWNASVFTTYGLPGGLALSGSLGYSRIFGYGREDRNLITTQTQASYRFPGGAAATVGVQSDFRQTSLAGEDFGLVSTQSYYGSFSYPVAPSIRASIRAAYSTNSLTGVGNERSNQPLDYLTAGVNVGWQALSWLNVNLGYTYNRYTGGFVETVDGSLEAVPGPPVTENRAYVNLTASF